MVRVILVLVGFVASTAVLGFGAKIAMDWALDSKSRPDLDKQI